MGQTVLNLNIATSAFYRPLLVSEYLDRVTNVPEIAKRGDRGLGRLRVYINYDRGNPPAGTAQAALPINRPNARVRTICEIGARTVSATTFGGANTNVVTYLDNGEFMELRQDEKLFR